MYKNVLVPNNIEILSMSREKVLKLIKSIDEVNKENLELYEKHEKESDRKEEKIYNIFREEGIEFGETKRVPDERYMGRVINTKYIFKPSSWVKKWILPQINTYKPNLITKPSIKEYDEEIEKINEEKRVKEEKAIIDGEKLIKAINILGSESKGTPKEIIELATKREEEKLIKSNNNEIFDLKYYVCECETWTFGEDRCSCGNKKIWYTIEGDIVFGLYLSIESY